MYQSPLTDRPGCTIEGISVAAHMAPRIAYQGNDLGRRVEAARALRSYFGEVGLIRFRGHQVNGGYEEAGSVVKLSTGPDQASCRAMAVESLLVRGMRAPLPC